MNTVNGSSDDDSGFSERFFPTTVSSFTELGDDFGEENVEIVVYDLSEAQKSDVLKENFEPPAKKPKIDPNGSPPIQKHKSPVSTTKKTLKTPIEFTRNVSFFSFYLSGILKINFF